MTPCQWLAGWVRLTRTALDLNREIDVFVAALPTADDDARTVEPEASHTSPLLSGQAAAVPARAAAATFADPSPHGSGVTDGSGGPPTVRPVGRAPSVRAPRATSWLEVTP